MEKIGKFILSILYDIIKNLIEGLFLIIITLLLLAIMISVSLIIPTLLLKITGSVIVFCIASILQFIILDLKVNDRNYFIDYLKNKWNEVNRNE